MDLKPAELTNLTLAQLAMLMTFSWKNIYFGAVPYLKAMRCLQSIDDDYGADSGKDMVSYFLANAKGWRGPEARLFKAELNRRLKG